MIKTRKNKIKKFFLTISLIFTFLILSFLIVFTIFYNKYSLNVEKLTEINNGIKVYAYEDNEPTLFNTNRSIIELNTLPEYVKNAFIDTEDHRFYSHNGYDTKRIIKASIVNIISHSKSQGASTISQQLIKNTLLNNEKTYKRKIQEVVLSMKMEKNFSKDKILEMYLNTIYFGSNAYGIENASNVFFNKSAKDLTLNEACCLAGIIKSPKFFSPLINYDNCFKRKNIVANQMLKYGHINRTQYDEIVKSPIVLSKNHDSDFSYEKEAIYEACSILNISERDLINEQYQIVTNKNNQIQKQVIEANSNVVDSLNSTLDSITIISDNNGKIIAYFENSNYNLHNLRRQPASTLKPLAVYLPCLINNVLSPASQILDEPTDFNGFKPRNANNKYYGYISTREALSKSSNICAVKALEYVGLKKSKECLLNLGINLANSDLNLNLALGSIKNGTTFLELVHAYSIIANLGTDKGLSFINKILDKNGNVIYSNEKINEHLFEKSDCFLLTDMLKDTVKNGTARRFQELNLPIASKTGTAFNGKSNTDIYNIAYTPDYTVLSWIADLKNNFLADNILSSVETTEINKQIFKNLYKNIIPKDFVKPENVQKFAYDTSELNNNHIIITPETNLERYISYDYFKIDNQPKAKQNSNDLILNVTLSELGAKISFQPKKYNTYTLFKVLKDNKIELAKISNSDVEFIFLDSNVFKHNEIGYYLENSNSKSETIEIRPKDYLINKLNNNILHSKKKWFV